MRAHWQTANDRPFLLSLNDCTSSSLSESNENRMQIFNLRLSNGGWSEKDSSSTKATAAAAKKIGFKQTERSKQADGASINLLHDKVLSTSLLKKAISPPAQNDGELHCALCTKANENLI